MVSAKPYKGQRYQKIKKECIRKKTLFRDSEFPPEGPSLFYSKAAPADIVWKRPGDIVSNPRFFTEGRGADDFSQGSLGNCWFVAACACIAERKNLLRKRQLPIRRLYRILRNKTGQRAGSTPEYSISSSGSAENGSMSS